LVVVHCTEQYHIYTKGLLIIVAPSAQPGSTLKATRVTYDTCYYHNQAGFNRDRLR
jgi:hypothetical protein